MSHPDPAGPAAGPQQSDTPFRGDASAGEVEILEVRCVHRSPWVSVYDDRVRFPGGQEGTSFRWRWAAPFGVIVLPLLVSAGEEQALLIEQFRHNDRAWRLEAPRGFGTEGWAPEQSARQEVAEETGLVAEDVQLVRQLGAPDYPVYLFLARGRQRAAASPEASEAIRTVHAFSRQGLEELRHDRRILDAETLVLLEAWGRS